MNAAKLKVRRGLDQDLDDVLALCREARSGHATLVDRREDFERLLERSPATLLVAEIDEELVGVLIAGWDGWRGNLYRLAVKGNHRRHGIGAELVRAGEACLRQSGARRVTALVGFDDQGAGAFWDAVDYPLDTEIGRRARNV